MRDPDPLYVGLFSESERSIGLRPMVSAPRTPVMNPYAERVIGTLRRECLDHVIVLGLSGDAVSDRLGDAKSRAPSHP